MEKRKELEDESCVAVEIITKLMLQEIHDKEKIESIKIQLSEEQLRVLQYICYCARLAYIQELNLEQCIINVFLEFDNYVHELYAEKE